VAGGGTQRHRVRLHVSMRLRDSREWCLEPDRGSTAPDRLLRYCGPAGAEGIAIFQESALTLSAT
jgi:hypothetical protein